MAHLQNLNTNNTRSSVDVRNAIKKHKNTMNEILVKTNRKINNWQ